MPKTALHIIASGDENPEDLKRCLASVRGQVDHSFVLITSPLKDEALRDMGPDVTVEYEPKKFFHTITKKNVDFIKSIGLKPFFKKGDKIFRFDKARNAAMDMVPKSYDWLLWLDVDDIYRGGQLRQIVADAEEQKLDAIFLNYIYQADIVDGKIVSILIEHLRERIIRNTDLYEWVAPIHETLIEKKPTRKRDDKRGDVLHLSTVSKMQTAIMRNIKNLEYSLCEKEAKDPRPIYYLGKAYFDLWMNEKNKDYLVSAKRLFETYLQGENPSGWKEERSQCWEYLMEIYRSLGEHNNSIKCAHNALIEDERFPSIYINLALCYINKQEWGRALFWVKLASKLDQPETTLVASPKDLMGRTLEVVYHASLNLSLLDEAYSAAVKLVELHPDNEDLKQRFTFTSQLREQRDVTKLMVQLASYLEQSGQKNKLKPLTMAMPEIVKSNPFMADLMKKVNPPRAHGDKEITIYCGPGFGSWSPKIMKDPGESFIGGSEEAVIYLAQALNKEGWKVTVYAEPGDDEGDHDGVNYLPYYRFNPKDKFNILVSWRRPDMVDQDLDAKKIYIWCHDIQNQLDYTPERLLKIEKIFVLSPWHRTNIPNIPDEKIVVSTNGIDEHI